VRARGRVRYALACTHTRHVRAHVRTRGTMYVRVETRGRVARGFARVRAPLPSFAPFPPRPRGREAETRRENGTRDAHDERAAPVSRWRPRSSASAFLWITAKSTRSPFVSVGLLYDYPRRATRPISLPA